MRHSRYVLLLAALSALAIALSSCGGDTASGPGDDAGSSHDVAAMTDTHGEDVAVSSDVAPAEDTVPVEDIVPAEDIVPVEDVPPIEDIVPIEDAVAEDIQPAEDIVPSEDVVGEDVQPAEDIVPSEDVPPVEDIVPVEDVPPVEDIVPIEDIVPVEDVQPAEDVLPIEDVPPAEDIVPIEDVADEDVTPEPDVTGSLSLNGPCEAANHLGGFAVEANDNFGYTAISGSVKDFVVAGQIPEVIAEEGGCQLLRGRRIICEPPCEPGQTCDLGETCVDMPRGQDVGAVTFEGLVQPVTIEALQPGNTYFFTRLSHPGFEPGAEIHVTNTTGYVAPMDLYGVGVAPLQPVEDTWVITEGEALEINWDVPEDGTHSHLFFEINIDQHGLSPANLVCSLPDTGHAVVPVAMTDALIAAGVTGYPSGRLARRTVDSNGFAEGCVELVISSVRDSIDIEVTGFLPCTTHDDCPSGQCDLLIQQCL